MTFIRDNSNNTVSELYGYAVVTVIMFVTALPYLIDKTLMLDSIIVHMLTIQLFYKCVTEFGYFHEAMLAHKNLQI